jgi:hypothetical protein
VFAVLLFVVIFSMAAFTVDVGNWYVTGQQNQRAADAAALAGVTFMPGSFADASDAAREMSTRNGLADGGTVDVAPTRVAGQASRLEVTVTRTVDNAFGGLFGVNQTTISRTAIAAFTGPVPMGSPCNEFGNDPTAGFNPNKSTNCDQVGQFWANVGSAKANKVSGDAYQNGSCGSGDGCSGGTNKEYDDNGYFYTLTVKRDMPQVTVEAFDPAFVGVGDLCNIGTYFGTGARAAQNAKNDYVYDIGARSHRPGEGPTTSVRYAGGASNAHCTGDVLFGAPESAPDTTFTLRKPVATTYPWDPTSYEPVGGTCTQQFLGYAGPLYDKLNQWDQEELPAGSKQYAVMPGAPAAPDYDATVARTFRQWVPLCTMLNVKKGTYMIQVQTNGPADKNDGNGHNRFALRAYGANATENGNIAVAGYTKMAMYANLPSAVTQFYLAQVPPTAKGQILNIRLFDIGDSDNDGTVRILPPPDSGITRFPTCIGSGPRDGPLADCSIRTNKNDFQGRWQSVAIPLPSTYSCDTTIPTGCWVKLEFNYGSGNQPSDTTSWQASIGGDPVRLVK